MISHILVRYGGWILIPFLGTATWIRLTGLGRVINSNHDEINPLLAGFRLTQSHFFATGAWAENFFVQLFLYYNGASSPLIQFINLEILNLLGVSLREFFLFLPYVICGLLSILGIYCLGNQWFGKPTGLLAAILATVAPYHGVISRINHPMMGIFVNQVFLFLVANQLFKTKRKSWAALLCLFLTFEILFNNGFPFTILILLYFGLVNFHREGDTPKLFIHRLMEFLKETSLNWWGIIPLLFVLFQFGLFAVALQRGELLGLLAWSFGHKRPIAIHPDILRVFGNSFGYLLILTALAAFLQNLRQLFQINILGLQIWWIILLGLPFLIVFSAQEVHLIATCGIPVFLLVAHWITRGLQSQNLWIRIWTVAFAIFVTAEALSGSMVVNLGAKTPSEKWYNVADTQGAVGSDRQLRAIKSAGYWIRKFSKSDARVYINKYPRLGEFYLGTVLCSCGDPKRKRLFEGNNFGPKPPVDYFVILDDIPPVTTPYFMSDDLRILLQKYHLVGYIRENGKRLARIFSLEPQPIRNLEHEDAVRRFDKEFARLDRYVTNPYAGMSFWFD